jgi:drug/metabolite transporter (DMT)-like permease
LSGGNILGILLTLAGIYWVVLESNTNHKPSMNTNNRVLQTKNWKGILSGLLAASGQACGVVLAKLGLGDNFPALSANVIRMSAAFLALWLVTIFQRQVISTFKQTTDRRSGLQYILGGAIFGPIIGVSLSLYAIQNTNVGIASTIIALPPVFLLPIGYFVYKERISWQAIAGTLLAITGVGLLFWL